MSMDGNTFALLAKKTLGADWQTEIARYYRKNPRTIRYWVNDEFNIPSEVEDDLLRWSDPKEGWRKLLEDRVKWEVARTIPSKDDERLAYTRIGRLAAAENNRITDTWMRTVQHEERERELKEVAEAYDFLRESALQDQRWIAWCDRRNVHGERLQFSSFRAPTVWPRYPE